MQPGDLAHLRTPSAPTLTPDGRLVAVVGLSDTVIVQTSQITLVCPTSEAERIKDLVAEVDRDPAEHEDPVRGGRVAVARGVLESVAEGTIPQGEVDELVLIVAVGLGGAAFAATGEHNAGPQEAVVA
jgi:hypothetical protein